MITGNHGQLLEIIIIAFIVGTIAWILWKGGGANSVGTSGLDRRVTEIGGKLTGLNTKVGEIEERVDAIEGGAASKEDIGRLEKLIDGQSKKANSRERALGDLSQMVAKQSAQVEHTSKQVDRLYDVIVSKGMDA